jgi:hypothetical protein
MDFTRIRKWRLRLLDGSGRRRALALRGAVGTEQPQCGQKRQQQATTGESRNEPPVATR